MQLIRTLQSHARFRRPISRSLWWTVNLVSETDIYPY
jgi:hypothetical protein